MFQFLVTNNVAEYKVIAAGLKMARQLGVRRLTVDNDSQLVIHQVNGSSEFNDSTLTKYLRLVQLIMDFHEVVFLHILRLDNAITYALSKGKIPSNMKTLAKPSLETSPSKIFDHSGEDIRPRIANAHNPNAVGCHHCRS